MLVYVGTYTESILFGTGEIVQGKGEGIYIYHMDESSGALKLINKATGIRNPSYLVFDSAKKRVRVRGQLHAQALKPLGAFGPAHTGRFHCR